jgi:DNA-binding MarR family transcriptional regulator
MTASVETTVAPLSDTQRVAWVAQVAQDRDLPPTAWRIAPIINQNLPRQANEVALSQNAMGDSLGCHVDTVARAIDAMVARGHLQARREGEGRANSTRYRPILSAENTRRDAGIF